MLSVFVCPHFLTHRPGASILFVALPSRDPERTCCSWKAQNVVNHVTPTPPPQTGNADKKNNDAVKGKKSKLYRKLISPQCQIYVYSSIKTVISLFCDIFLIFVI